MAAASTAACPARHGRADPRARHAPGLQLIDRLFEAAQPVAAGIVPGGRQDHRPREKLGARQRRLRRGGDFILRQAPAGIEGLAKDARAVPGQDRLEPHLRGHGIDRDRPFQQLPGRDGRGQQRNTALCVARPVMARPQTQRVSGWVLIRIRAPGFSSCARTSISRKRWPPRPHGGPRHRRASDRRPAHSPARARSACGSCMLYFDKSSAISRAIPSRALVQNVRIVQGIAGEERFDQRGRAAVEMNAEGVDQQAKRRVALPAGAQGPQEGVLDPHQAARRRARPAPRLAAHRATDPRRPPHRPRGDGGAEVQFVPGQLQDPAQTRLAQKSCVAMKEPPGNGPGGAVLI
jgi:hypothetical protein